MKTYFYFQIFRKTLIQFLDTFNDIKIARYELSPSAGLYIDKYIEVPIKLSIKEKQWYWINERKDDVQLPMITAWLSSIDWAQERQANSFYEICKTSNTNRADFQKYIHPTAYNLGVSMSIWSKHMVDIDQIIEQILPYFNPHIMIRIEVEELGISFDAKVIFRSCTPEVSHEMADDEYRTIVYNLEFEIQTWFFTPTQSSGLIKKIYTSIFPDQTAFNNYIADTTSTFSSGASGGVQLELKGRVEDGELLVKYNVFDSPGNFSSSSSSTSTSSSSSSEKWE